jgi:succinate dehydrogenase/fumarate reductase flavoprotein subunit
VPGLYAAGDMASVPHNYMLGAFTYGSICARNALDHIAQAEPGRIDDGEVAFERRRVLAPLNRPDGIQPHLLEYKLRRHVNDYLQPPKSAHRLERGLDYFLRASEEVAQLGATDPHDLMRALECGFIRDCAEMAARASLFREESRWGLYHYRQDFPELDDENWFVHVNLKSGDNGAMHAFKRPVEPYVVPLDEAELENYRRIRIPAEPAIA